MDKEQEIEEFLRITGVAASRPAAVLEITGDDALTFLQGQFTQELRPDRALAASYGLWLNQKGRVVGDSQVLRASPHRWWLVSQETPAAMLRQRLEEYIIADDVTVVDRTGEVTGGVWVGEPARVWLERQLGRVPGAGEVHWHPEQVVWRGRRGFPDTWEMLTFARGVEPAGLAPLSAEDLERGRIAAGVPAVPRDVGLQDLPNEGGLEEEAISFNKGCYLGQEVMARLKSLGRVRRRLVRVRGPSGLAPAAGTPLQQSGRTVAEVRSAVGAPRGGWLGLAMLTLLHVKGGTGLSRADTGETVELWDAPLS